MVKVSAPGKLMLLGEHSVVYNRPCIVTAVNHRMSVSIEKISGTKITLNAPEVKIDKYEIDMSELGKEHPKGARFVLTAVKNFFEKYDVKSGLDIRTKAEFSAEFGFGSSSAATVCTIKGLAALAGIKMTNKELFDLCYKTVLDIQGAGSGFDVAAAIWGGTLWFVTGGKEIRQLKTGPIPLVVGYTGIKADTTTLVKKVAEQMKIESAMINKIFDDITELVKTGVSDIEDGRWSEFGRKMNYNQSLLEKLGVSTPELDRLISAARSVGAGAKLSGAGGGDCMIAVAEPEKEETVQRAIASAGGTLIPVKTGVEGVKIEG